MCNLTIGTFLFIECIEVIRIESSFELKWNQAHTSSKMADTEDDTPENFLSIAAAISRNATGSVTAAKMQRFRVLFGVTTRTYFIFYSLLSTNPKINFLLNYLLIGLPYLKFYGAESVNRSILGIDKKLWESDSSLWFTKLLTQN